MYLTGVTDFWSPNLNTIATIDREKPHDIIDMTLIEREDSDMKADDMYSNAHIIQSLIDLLSAGVETIISASKWWLIELIHHPDIQTKIHQELDEVIPANTIIMSNHWAIDHDEKVFENPYSFNP
uniref:Steroid 17-alpha-hydroxylase/17,20 lyase-like n=1 Tax=Saccoglossus kowalevskii TaxID=10224 RepID=A0ABM0M9T5_SACKO|nr:PREDICTED: steroid 17-alpha-hydroxylase/17,20 lyase-like [Saccoglossus kowalevskii]